MNPDAVEHVDGWAIACSDSVLDTFEATVYTGDAWGEEGGGGCGSGGPQRT